MTGVTAWNQQVPLPQKYFGDNAWRLPLAPKLSDNPVSGKSSLFKGAIAVAVNGVPIFNPIKQDGRTDTNLAGELDKFGGHAGRGDDYHYHLPPTFLNKLVGDQRPIGFGMDGFPLYGFNEADGTPAKNLDAYNGHDHDGIGYHYHSTTTYPYLNGGLRGVVAMKDGEVALQPRDQAVREFTRPLRGATITEFEKLDGLGYSLTYKLDGEDYVIKVSPQEDGSAKFVFIDPDGTKNEQLYKPMTRPERGPDRGEEGPPKERDRD
ncbi:MAG: YHYH protein [Akkermansiaceae bacterium]